MGDGGGKQLWREEKKKKDGKQNGTSVVISRLEH